MKAATSAGVAASLGLGAMQIGTSLDLFFGVPDTRWVQIAIIAAITAVATVSVVLGVKRGIQRLSVLNIALAGLLLVLVLFAGPTLNVYTSTDSDGSDLAPWSVYEASPGGTFVRIWPGFAAGIRAF